MVVFLSLQLSLSRSGARVAYGVVARGWRQKIVQGSSLLALFSLPARNGYARRRIHLPVHPNYQEVDTSGRCYRPLAHLLSCATSAGDTG